MSEASILRVSDLSNYGVYDYLHFSIRFTWQQNPTTVCLCRICSRTIRNWQLHEDNNIIIGFYSATVHLARYPALLLFISFVPSRSWVCARRAARQESVARERNWFAQLSIVIILYYISFWEREMRFVRLRTTRHTLSYRTHSKHIDERIQVNRRNFNIKFHLQCIYAMFWLCATHVFVEFYTRCLFLCVCLPCCCCADLSSVNCNAVRMKSNRNSFLFCCFFFLWIFRENTRCAAVATRFG